MLTIALIILLIVAVIYMKKSNGKGKEEGVPYICTRCEMMFYSPNIPLNSKCPSCGGGVQPY